MTAASPQEPAPSPRIVSLIASATEIVHALGLGSQQVARSHECDWPPAVLRLPQLTSTKFKVQGATSAEIDRSVKGLVEQGLAVYEVDAAGLEAIRPDLILTQDQCEVCAVSLADVERAVCTFTGSTARIVSCRPHSLADVYDDIARIAGAADAASAGAALIQRMRQRFAALRALTAPLPVRSLAFIEWVDPPMSGGHWMPELIEIAGGVSLFGDTGSTSPWITWDAVAATDPDVILVAPCGYDIETTTRAMSELRGHPVWESLRAVREGRVFTADGNAYFNRPGPRLVESAEIAAEVLHPEACDFGHRGHAYRPFQ
ncbi:MAG: cobalamin-binding protein [Hyphomicrobiaceae bacterium]|nr:cobalamin-binding protein [Hyphomicrobiaceae bacterium]